MTDPLLQKAKQELGKINDILIHHDIDGVRDEEKRLTDLCADYILAKNNLELAIQTIPTIVEGIKNRDR